MADTSYRAVLRTKGFPYLFVFCGGVWLFASDELMVATLLADIVREIGGANLIGWGSALFQAAAIVSGALGAFLLRRWGMRLAFTGSALLFVLGCMTSAAAPNMEIFQLGRFFQALAGSSLTTLNFIGVPNLFGRELQARAMSIVSVIWGFAAFTGPLIGGIFAEFSNWRMAFVFAGSVALAIAIAGLIAFGRLPRFRDPAVFGSTEKFPLVRMAMLFAGVLIVATAGVLPSPLVSPLLIATGVGLVAVFFLRDRKMGEHRLLPYDTLDPKSRVGAGVYMLAALSAAVVGIYTFAPVFVAFLFSMPPLRIGYMMFGEALGWSIMAVVVSGTPPERDGRVIVVGASLLVAAILTFNLSFHLSLEALSWIGFLLQGFGFGALWSLTLRRAADHPDRLEVDRIAGALPTMHRLGLGLGAALLGLLANMVGFSSEMDLATSQSVGIWIAGVALPCAILGLVAALRFARAPRRMGNAPEAVAT